MNTKSSERSLLTVMADFAIVAYEATSAEPATVELPRRSPSR